MARKRAATFLTILATGFIAGCVDGQGPFATRNSDNSVPEEEGAAGSTRIVERDVEAPEVFQVTEQGLWDGRPSLGGVWVAYADVKDPERVIIRNTGNGKFVIGALFRRERDNPGPALQVSSDAAAALGMLAGAPGELNVTALKREEVPIAQPGDAAAENTDSIDLPDPGSDAALDTVLASTAPDTAAEPAVPEPAAETTAPAIAAAAAALATAPEAETPFDQIVAGATAALDRADRSPGGAAPIAPAPVGAGVTDAIEVAAIAPEAGAAAPAPEVRVPAPQPAKASKLDKAYIQIGIFSVEGNAKNTLAALSHDGMVGSIKTAEASGKSYWRVVVGPASNAAERTELLKKVKALGFSDAYLVSG